MKNLIKKPVLAVVLTLVMVISLMSPVMAATADASADAVAQITVVHTNDVHARVNGEAYVSSLVKQKKAAGENVLLLSAGDVLHGQTIATLTKGKNIATIMNAVGYDAMAPGNHDFNYGSKRLKTLSEQMNFPVLAANVYRDYDRAPAYQQYMVKTVGGVKVGIFGLATPETVTKTNPSNVDTLIFEAPVKAAQLAVNELRIEGCDVIIALAHLGLDKETWPHERSTALTEVNGIDLIIDGHSHTALPNGMLENDVLIAQTGSYCENIGVVDLTVKNGRVTAKTAELVPVPAEATADFSPDAGIVNLIAAMNEKDSAITSQIVASTPVFLQGEREYVRARETNFGNLIADSMIYETGADIALHNGGSIRASIQPGNITKGDILTVLPFGNYIVVKQMSGADVIAMLEHGISNYPALSGGFPQVAGIKFKFDASAQAGKRIVSVEMADGKMLDTTKVYRVATNDFLADGGDGYTMIGNSGGLMSYSALDEALISYLQTNPAIRDGVENRIVEVTEKPADIAA